MRNKLEVSCNNIRLERRQGMCNKAIEEFNKGNPEALRDIYVEIAKDIYIYGFVVTGNSLDGEKVLADTMKKVSKLAYKYNPKKDGKVWILSLARECAKDIIKTRELQNVVQDNEYIEMIQGNEAFVSTLAREQMDKLESSQREVLALFSFSQFSSKNVAKILKMPVFKVKKISKAVRKYSAIIEALRTLELPGEEVSFKECMEPNPKKCKFYRRAKIIVRNSIVLAGLAVIVTIAVLVPRSYIMKENYKHAIAFFEENGLDRGDMSKEKLIEVYKDIVNNEFKERRTKKVLSEAINKASLEGEMILCTPDMTAENMWSKLWFNEYVYKRSEPEIEYICDDSYSFDDGSIIEIEGEYYEEIIREQKGVVIKGYDNTVIWEVTFDDFLVGENGGCVEWGENVVVYGTSGEGYSQDPMYTHLALIDSEGNILWQIKFDEGYLSETVEEIIVKDNRIVVFTETSNNSVIFREVDAKGNSINVKTELGETQIRQVIPYGDGYMLLQEEFDIITYCDASGHRISSKVLSHEWDSSVSAVNIATYNGKLYFSTYSETSIYKEYDWLDLMEMSDKEIMEIYRGLNNAALWVADYENNVYTEVCSVKGANGKEIEIDEEGNIVWSVLGFEEGKYVGSSGVTYEGTARYYEYVLDEDNKLVKQYKTDKKEDFSN